MQPNDQNIELYKKEVAMMNLERLIASRENVPATELKIPLEDLLARYERLYTGAISDVLREIGRAHV